MRKSILVIDDEIAVRKSFLLALEDTDYKVETVDSGLKGIEKVGQNIYDLIFLDLKMPEIDGVETLRRIRSVNNTVPVYIVTAFFGEYFDRLSEVRADGIDFELVRKPIGMGQILQLVQGVLGEPQSC